MLTDSSKTDRFLVLLEDLQTKVELFAGGHLQLVDGQQKLGTKIDAVQSKLRDVELRLSSQINRNALDIRELAQVRL